MSQPPPTTPIHPLFVFLFDTERFFLDTLKNSTLDPAIHTKLKTAFHKFRKWGLENHNHLVSIADDLENSEVHKPKNYKGYQMLFWRFRALWPNVCLVQQVMKDREKTTGAGQRPPTPAEGGGSSSSTAKTSSVQPSPQIPAPPTSASAHDTTTTSTTTTTTTTTTAILFSRFKSPVMLPFAKWWAESQDKREGPLLPASSFEEAVEGICSSISLIVDDWEAEIVPLLVVSDVVDGQREASGGPGAGA